MAPETPSREDTEPSVIDPAPSETDIFEDPETDDSGSEGRDLEAEEAADRATEDPEATLEEGEEEEKTDEETAEEAIEEAASEIKPKGRLESAMESLGKGLATLMEKLGPLLEKLGKMMEIIQKAMNKAFAPLVPSLIKMGIEPPEWMMDKKPGMKEVTDAVMKSGRTLEAGADDGRILREIAQIHQETEAEFTKKNRSYSMEQFMSDTVTGIDASKEKITFGDIKAKALEISADKKAEAAAIAAPAASAEPEAPTPAPAEPEAPAPTV